MPGSRARIRSNELIGQVASSGCRGLAPHCKSAVLFECACALSLLRDRRGVRRRRGRAGAFRRGGCADTGRPRRGTATGARSRAALVRTSQPKPTAWSSGYQRRLSGVQFDLLNVAKWPARACRRTGAIDPDRTYDRLEKQSPPEIRDESLKNTYRGRANRRAEGG